MNPSDLLHGYDPNRLTIGALGGHSALDVCAGAKKWDFRTVVVAQKGRERTYSEYYRMRNPNQQSPITKEPPNTKSQIRGCIDETIVVEKFENVLQEETQAKLRNLNTVFVPSRYCWVYLKDFAKFENGFAVPVFGNRSYVKYEERNCKPNQYDLLNVAGIRTPKIFEKPKDIDRPVIVKAHEKQRKYERAFFLAESAAGWEREGTELEKMGRIDADWRRAVIEEYIFGAHVNFNFFYSPLTGELELLGTDTRRQTNLDGLLRMPAREQLWALNVSQVRASHVETGHIAVTVKESLLEKAFDLGERFVKATKSFLGREIIGPFALQGAVVAEEGKEDIVIFDVSLRIPGSPGTCFTPYSGYLHGENLSYGERIAMEIRRAVTEGRLEDIVT